MKTRLVRLLMTLSSIAVGSDSSTSTNFCSEEYDQLVADARTTQDNDQRYELYADMEEMLFGEEGEMPIIPIYWYTYTQLEHEKVRDTYDLNLLDQIDLTQVEVQG